jgi:hypothetical protein
VPPLDSPPAEPRRDHLPSPEPGRDNQAENAPIVTKSACAKLIWTARRGSA